LTDAWTFFTSISINDVAHPTFFSTQVDRGIYTVPEIAEEVSDELEVVCAGWEACRSEYLIERTDFPYNALEFIAGGEWELRLEGETHQLRPGSVFAYGPGTAYTLQARGESGWSKYFVDFGGTAAGEQLRAAGLEAGAEALVLQHRWLRELFDQLVETRHFAPAVQRRLARSTSRLILERLPHHLTLDDQKTAAWLSFERCRDCLSEHYLTLPSLSAAAAACAVSPAYLSRLFHRFSNESPKAFVDRMRMNHAAQKLLRGDFQVKVVAAEVGYADVFHFSRVFKRCFGVPPSEYAQRAGRRGVGGRW